MEKYCQNCGAKLKENSKFCQECGHEVDAKNIPKTCPNCGEAIEDSLNFCEHCGTELNAPKTITKKESFFKRNTVPIVIIATIAVVALIIVATLIITAPEPDVGTYSVSVGTNRFEIPGDFVIAPSTIDVDYTGYNAVFSQGYGNDEGEAIYIQVMNIPPGVDGESVASSQGGVQKELMGVNGYYIEEDDGVYTFAFVDGAYLNVVSVSSPYILDEMTYLG